MSKKSAAEPDLVRASVVGSFDKARRRALDAIPEFKRFSEVERRQFRKGPQTLADMLAGTVRGKPDPIHSDLQRAWGDLASRFNAGETLPLLEEIRLKILNLVLFDPTKKPNDMVLFVTAWIYELIIELAEESGRENGGRRDNANEPEEQDHKYRLTEAAEKCWRKHPDWSLSAVARHVKKELALAESVDAVRKRIERLGIKKPRKIVGH